MLTNRLLKMKERQLTQLEDSVTSNVTTIEHVVHSEISHKGCTTLMTQYKCLFRIKGNLL